MLRPAEPIDVALTLRPLARGMVDPTMRVQQGEVWRATRTPEGPATMRVCNSGNDIVVTAWGEGATRALDQAEELVGVKDDHSAFRPSNRRLRELTRHLAGLRLACTRRVVEVLIPTVVEQRVQGMEARKSYRSLVRETSEPAPGPSSVGTGLMLPPDPARLATMPYYEFHSFGIERRRADVIRRICSAASRLEETCDMDRATARQRLTAISGVGPWTSEYCMLLALGDPDAVIVGDYNLPSVVAWVLAGERSADDDRMLELLEPFRGQRGRAMLIIEASGIRPPRRAPRSRVRSIARI